MPNVIITGSMNLPIPTLTDFGPDYANNVNTCLTIVSSHTHDGSTNGGSLIDLAKQQCLSNLSINGFNLTNVKSIELNNQSSALTGSQDVNCLYVNQNQLGFNNNNGIFIPITSGNTLAITALSLTNWSSRNVTSNFTILPSDTYNLINIDSTGNTVDGYLPIAASITPVAANRLYLFKDIGNHADTKNITIHVSTGSGNTFADSGGTTFVINNPGGYVGFYTDGVSKWFPFVQSMYNSSTVNYKNSLVNYTNSIINTSATTVAMTNTTQQLLGSSLLQLTGTSQASFDANTLLTFTSGSQITGTTKLSAIVNNMGSITANIAGGFVTSTAGGLISNVAVGVESLVGGGIASGVPGGISLIGGASDWITYTSDGITPQGRTVLRKIPLEPYSWATDNIAPPSSWSFKTTSVNSIGSVAVAFNNADGYYIELQIRAPIDGATLNSVVIRFFTTTTHTPSNVPSILVNRVNNGVSVNTLNTNPAFQNFSGTFTGGTIQNLAYFCNTNNVIDRSLYIYNILLKDESGPGSVPQGNQYLDATLNFSVFDSRPQ